MKKHISAKKVNQVQTKKHISAQKVKKQTPATNKKKLNARELLIMLERRPEIATIIDTMFEDEAWAAYKEYADYLKFLVVKGIEQDFDTMQISPPCLTSDSLWYSHILDTKAYHNTCVHLFGQYVHHKPKVKKTPQRMNSYWAAHAKHFPGDVACALGLCTGPFSYPVYS